MSKKAQMKGLVLAVMLGTWVWEAVLEEQGEDPQRARRVLQEALEMAKKARAKGVYRVHGDHLDPGESLCEEEEEIMEEFVESTFWGELFDRLGMDREAVASKPAEETPLPKKDRVVN